MSDPRIELLDELTERLENLVSTLGGVEVPSATVLDRSWNAATEAFERFRVVAEELGHQPAPEDVRSRMEAVLRLDAVAVGLASRHRDGLATELQKMSGARARLKVLDAARRSVGTGDSCDMTG